MSKHVRVVILLIKDFSVDNLLTSLIGSKTRIKLLMRFYDPQHGQILIDGQDIRCYKLKSLRDQITFLQQEAMVFDKTSSGFTTPARVL